MISNMILIIIGNDDNDNNENWYDNNEDCGNNNSIIIVFIFKFNIVYLPFNWFNITFIDKNRTSNSW